MSEIQPEGWFVAGSGDLDGQDCLTFFAEEGIDWLQQNGCETGCGLRKFSVEEQFSVKLQLLSFQSGTMSRPLPVCGLSTPPLAMIVLGRLACPLDN